jgi:hypothetical protein
VTIFKGVLTQKRRKLLCLKRPLIKQSALLGTDLGLEWGGNWKKVDELIFNSAQLGLRT